MTSSQAARTPARPVPRMIVVGLLVVSAATGAALGYQLQASSSSAAASPINALRSLDRGAAPATAPESPRAQSRPARGPAPPRGPDGVRQPPARPPGAGAPGQADGAVPDGTTVFDDEMPGVANLNPALLGALRQAATDAADDGVRFYVNSGWRSREYQNQLLREAITQYGSAKEAARWVATPDMSPHVSGDAIDLDPFNATAWLSKHAATYGLCRIYRNEPWHYELRPEAIDRGCPPMYADPTHDPRMRQ